MAGPGNDDRKPNAKVNATGAEVRLGSMSMRSAAFDDFLNGYGPVSLM